VSDEWRDYFDALQNMPGTVTRDVAHAPVIASFAQMAKQNKLTKPSTGVADKRQIGVLQMINAYRFLGNRWAQIDPLKRQERPAIAELEPSYYGFTEADLSLAERLGHRAATAVENARLYTERTRIAVTLQHALRPQSLPEIPGIEMSARYSPAGELNEAGGDFYDVFEPAGGYWTLVIGDVCGKGAGAAGVTALARHTLKAAAMSGQSPPEMLRILHQGLRHQPPGEDLCTVCLVTLARVREGARLGISLAGHQQPLLIAATGETEKVGEPGTLLGVRDPIEITESTATLGPGETLLLYTDGVLEGGKPRGRSGERRLLELCRQAPGLELSRFLERIERQVLESAGGALSDDVALLAIRPSPQPGQRTRWGRLD